MKITKLFCQNFEAHKNVLYETTFFILVELKHRRSFRILRKRDKKIHNLKKYNIEYINIHKSY